MSAGRRYSRSRRPRAAVARICQDAARGGLLNAAQLESLVKPHARAYAATNGQAFSARLLGSRFALSPLPEGALLTGHGKEADLSRLLLGKPTPCVGRAKCWRALPCLTAD